MFTPPVSREVEAKDVKYAIERAFSANVPNGYAGVYFGDLKGAPEAGAGADQGDPRHRDAGQVDDRLQPQQGHGRGARRRARDADLGPGAGGVRQGLRQGEPVDLRPGGRGLHRPVHGRVRRRGQGDRLRHRQEHEARPQPGLRGGGRLPPRVPRRDRDPGRQRGHGRGLAAHPDGREHGVRRHRAARAPAEGAARVQQDRALGRPGRRLALHLARHERAAVRQPRRAQGRRSRASTASRRASSAAARRSARSPSTSSRRAWPGSRSPAAPRAGPPSRTGCRSPRATARWPPSTSRRRATPPASTRATRRS